MWAIEDSPGPKAAYRGGYHFTPGYTTKEERATAGSCACPGVVMLWTRASHN